ncbi:hypothetical protein Ancab_034391 [Ancistrocladus abbreviatus]
MHWMDTRTLRRTDAFWGTISSSQTRTSRNRWLSQVKVKWISKEIIVPSRITKIGSRKASGEKAFHRSSPDAHGFLIKPEALMWPISEQHAVMLNGSKGRKSLRKADRSHFPPGRVCTCYGVFAQNTA